MKAHAMDQMLLAFWRQRDLESPWGRRLLIGLAVAGVCISLYFSPQWWQPVLGVSAVLILASLWMSVFGSLLEQNHPHAARFVPGHLRQLREAALGSWAVVTPVCAALLWLVLPKMPSFMATLLLTAATLAFAATLVMTVVTTALLPGAWLDPLGSLLKNLPILAALVVLRRRSP